MVVAAGGLSVAASSAPCVLRSAPEDRFEEGAEVSVAGLLLRAGPRAGSAPPAEFEAAVPTRGGLEGFAPGVPLADVVVRRAALGVDQRFVGLGYFLEARFGVGFLADIRVELAGQFAVGPLDVILRGDSLHAERGVVVLEFHAVPSVRCRHVNVGRGLATERRACRTQARRVIL